MDPPTLSTQTVIHICNSIQPYSGTSADGSPMEWLRHVHRVVWTLTLPPDGQGPDPQLLLRVASVRLTGTASAWADHQQFANWNDFRAKLQRRFGANTHAKAAQYQATYQRKGETVSHYAERLDVLRSELGLPEDEVAMSVFCKGLLPHLQEPVYQYTFNNPSLGEAVQFACHIDAHKPQHRRTEDDIRAPRDAAPRDHWHQGPPEQRRQDMQPDLRPFPRPYLPQPRFDPGQQPRYEQQQPRYDPQRPRFDGPRQQRPDQRGPQRQEQQPPRDHAAPNAVDQVTQDMQRMRLYNQRPTAHFHDAGRMNRAVLNPAYRVPTTGSEWQQPRYHSEAEHSRDEYSYGYELPLQSTLMQAAMPANRVPFPMPGASPQPQANPSRPQGPTPMDVDRRAPPPAARAPPPPADDGRMRVVNQTARPHADQARERSGEPTPAQVNREVGRAMAEGATRVVLDNLMKKRHVDQTASTIICCADLMGSSKLLNTGLKVAAESAKASERVLQSVDRAFHSSQVEPLRPAPPPQMAAQAGARAHANAEMEAIPPATGKSGRRARDATVVKLMDLYICGLPPKEVILDTGASHTTISTNLARQIGKHSEVQPTAITFTNADGHEAAPLGVLPDVLVRLHDTTIKQDVFVSQALQYDVLLGCDFLAMIGAVISLSTLTMTYTRDDQTKGSVPIALNPAVMHVIATAVACTSLRSGGEATPIPANTVPEAPAEDAHPALPVPVMVPVRRGPSVPAGEAWQMQAAHPEATVQELHPAEEPLPCCAGYAPVWVAGSRAVLPPVSRLVPVAGEQWSMIQWTGGLEHLAISPADAIPSPNSHIAYTSMRTGGERPVVRPSVQLAPAPKPGLRGSTMDGLRLPLRLGNPTPTLAPVEAPNPSRDWLPEVDDEAESEPQHSMLDVLATLAQEAALKELPQQPTLAPAAAEEVLYEPTLHMAPPSPRAGLQDLLESVLEDLPPFEEEQVDLAGLTSGVCPGASSHAFGQAGGIATSQLPPTQLLPTWPARDPSCVPAGMFEDSGPSVVEYYKVQPGAQAPCSLFGPDLDGLGAALQSHRPAQRRPPQPQLPGSAFAPTAGSAEPVGPAMAIPRMTDTAPRASGMAKAPEPTRERGMFTYEPLERCPSSPLSCSVIWEPEPPASQRLAALRADRAPPRPAHDTAAGHVVLYNAVMTCPSKRSHCTGTDPHGIWACMHIPYRRMPDQLLSLAVGVFDKIKGGNSSTDGPWIDVSERILARQPGPFPDNASTALATKLRIYVCKASTAKDKGKHRSHPVYKAICELAERKQLDATTAVQAMYDNWDGPTAHLPPPPSTLRLNRDTPFYTPPPVSSYHSLQPFPSVPVSNGPSTLSSLASSARKYVRTASEQLNPELQAAYAKWANGDESESDSESPTTASPCQATPATSSEASLLSEGECWEKMAHGIGGSHLSAAASLCVPHHHGRPAQIQLLSLQQNGPAAPAHAVSAAPEQPAEWLPAPDPPFLNLDQDWPTRPPAVPATGTINPALTPAQQALIKGVLDQFAHVFAQSKQDLGVTEAATFRIDTGAAKPVKTAPYRYNPLVQRQIDEEIDNLQRMGIIEPCSSPWASPVLAVAKPDGSIRMCVDLRKVNQVTVADGHPQPTMEDVLDTLAHHRYFSKVDGKHAYYQLRCADEATKDRTAFVTGGPTGGQYRYVRMPMGAKNCPAVWTRLNLKLFRPFIQAGWMGLYQDDAAIAANTVEEMTERLRLVLGVFAQHNLRLSPAKSCFCMEEMHLLGHIISGRGVKPDPEKIAVLLAYPEPRTVTQCKAFAGLANYYGRFCPHLAELAGPLHDAVKGKTLRWEAEQRAAFAAIKARLTSPPILRGPRWDRDFQIHTDWCPSAIAAILSQQDDDGTECVIAYASRRLEPAQRRYSATEGECLAVVWAIQRFHHYICMASRITIVTDHASLIWLLRNKARVGKIGRWCCEVQQYPLTIVHRPGKQHLAADALSRAYHSDSDSEPDEVVPVHTLSAAPAQ